jgi:hypothetical protein
MALIEYTVVVDGEREARGRAAIVQACRPAVVQALRRRYPDVVFADLTPVVTWSGYDVPVPGHGPLTTERMFAVHVTFDTGP